MQDKDTWQALEAARAELKKLLDQGAISPEEYQISIAAIDSEAGANATVPAVH